MSKNHQYSQWNEFDAEWDPPRGRHGRPRNSYKSETKKTDPSERPPPVDRGRRRKASRRPNQYFAIRIQGQAVDTILAGLACEWYDKAINERNLARRLQRENALPQEVQDAYARKFQAILEGCRIAPKLFELEPDENDPVRLVRIHFLKFGRESIHLLKKNVAQVESLGVQYRQPRYLKSLPSGIDSAA